MIVVMLTKKIAVSDFVICHIVVLIGIKVMGAAKPKKEVNALPLPVPVTEKDCSLGLLAPADGVTCRAALSVLPLPFTTHRRNHGGGEEPEISKLAPSCFPVHDMSAPIGSSARRIPGRLSLNFLG
jgi:hypothetical protein